MTVTLADTPPQTKQTFEEVFRGESGFVWRVLRSLGVMEAEIEDAMQDVFVVVHRRIGEWDGEKAREWLYAIAQKTASNYRRRSATRAKQPAIFLATDDMREEQRDLLRRLERVLEELDEDKRAVFYLYEVEDMTMPEVSRALDVPLKTAYARLYAARAIVSEKLELEGEP